MHIKIIIPMHNVEPWVKTTIASIMAQQYPNYQCVIIDDCSTDHSAGIVESMIDGHDKFTLIKNTTKKNALADIVHGIQVSTPKNNDVIITVDRDDWLAHPKVLTRVVEAYTSTNCMMTHGSFIEHPTKYQKKKHPING